VTITDWMLHFLLVLVSLVILVPEPLGTRGHILYSDVFDHGIFCDSLGQARKVCLDIQFLDRFQPDAPTITFIHVSGVLTSSVQYIVTDA
jgi:hypothetical protein